MALRAHVTLPFDRLSAELNLPMRGIIPSGVFVTRRSQPAPGWDATGLPVPELQVRRARQLYQRGIITPATPESKPPTIAPGGREHSNKTGKRR